MVKKVAYHNVVIDVSSGIGMSATITVYLPGTTTPAKIYSDWDGTPKSNPFSTDTVGRFSFFADRGEYDIKVSGTGITEYTISRVPIVPAHDKDHFTPEDYGAVGDGTTDDGPAFRAMFADLKIVGTTGYGQVRVKLSPTVYYKVTTAYDGTDVFKVDVQNIQMIGPGMSKPCLKYEGSGTLTNLLHFTSTCNWTHLQDINIEGHQAKIGTVVRWDGGILNTCDRVYAHEASAACFDGYTWGTKYTHCEAMNAPKGFGNVYTYGSFDHCYANHCAIGYYGSGFYALYSNCACDHATTAAYKLWTSGESGNHISLIECACEDAEIAIWGGGTNIDVFGGAFTGAGTTAPDFMLFEDCVFHLYNPRISASNTNYVRFNSGGYSAGMQPIITGDIPKSKIYAYFTQGIPSPFLLREEAHIADDISAGSLSNFPSTLLEYSSANYRKSFSFLFSSDAPTTLSNMVEFKWVKGAGRIYLPFDDLSGKITLASSTAAGMYLQDIDIDVHFRHYYFNINNIGYMFKVRNCRRIIFEHCKFETEVARSKVFDVDMNSRIFIDKDTMDNLATSGSGTWSGLCDLSAPWHAKWPIFIFTAFSDKPSAGIFDAGNRIYFDAPSDGGYPGAICTSSGSPGIWKYMAAIEA